VPEVVDRYSKLIRPVAIAVAKQEVAALFGRRLLERAGQQIMSLHSFRIELHTHPAAGRVRQCAGAATPDVAFAANVGPGAVTPEHVGGSLQRIEGIAIDLRRVALTHERIAAFIGHESEPVEVLDDRRLILGPAANAIMIFNPEQDTSAERTRDTPRVNGVDDMPDVKIASW